ncbi:hypothetical protein HYW55_00590 [Candidatus Gottesmanbacteria bacterium]|nr:hypothetical protein [Candidatus Gottesmanbacteria bacterium]
MTKVNNLRPEKAARFLINRGWEFINREGTHETYIKNENGITKSVQVIFNYKTIHWKNVKEMVKRTGIPEEEWIKECK